MGQAAISATLNFRILQEREEAQRSGDILVPEIVIVILILIEFDSREARQDRKEYGDAGRAKLKGRRLNKEATFELSESRNLLL